MTGIRTKRENGFKELKLNKKLLKENGIMTKPQVSGFKKKKPRLEQTQKVPGIKMRNLVSGSKVNQSRPKRNPKKITIKIQKQENGSKELLKLRITVRVVNGPKIPRLERLLAKKN